jgi:hypothetical protein
MLTATLISIALTRQSYFTVAAINLETPRFFYCKLFVTLTMLLTYQFQLRQSVGCAQR